MSLHTAPLFPPSRRAGLRRLLPLLALLCLCALGRSADASTLTVASDGSGQYPTIQAAINASQNGDTVLLADGTYTGAGNVDLDFLGKNITVTSQNGAAGTIIDCGGFSSPDGSGDHRGFILQSGETNAVISGLTIQNGYESGNGSSDGSGGGIEVNGNGTTVTVQNCVLQNDTAATYGGGLLNYGTVTLTNDTLTGDTAQDGGGLFNSGTVTLTNDTLTGDTAQYFGGGLANEGTLTLTNCTLTGNTAQRDGGGGLANEGTLTLTGCALTGDTAEIGGGLFNDYGHTATLTNCTLSGDTAQDGGGVYNSGGTATLTNDILYGDSGGELYNGSGGTASATNCDIAGGVPGGITDGGGNINADPRFVTPPTAPQLDSPAVGDVHLRPGSPCIGVGTPSGAPSVDKDGTARPTPPSIGAYEIGSTLTVALDGTGQYATIQAAISAANPGNTVLISDGTYTGPGNVDLDFGGRNITVTSVNGAASTIIDCGGFSSSDGSGDHRGFYLHTGETNAVISGLTIQNGYSSNMGGGINVTSVGATIQNCVFKNNTSIAPPGRAGGGGLYNLSGSSPITVIGCTFIGNTVANNGGGIFNDNEGSGAISVINCTFTSNTAPNNSGGGLFNRSLSSGAINITGCTLTGNTALGLGGGIYISPRNTGTITVTNCALTGNAVTGSNGAGGGIFNYTQSASASVVTNCTLTGNTAPANNGGGLTSNGGPITLLNDILYGDTGGEITGSNVTATDCDVQGGYAGTGNIAADPLFVNAPADLHLQSGSPCLGAGTPTGAPTTDKDGRTRPNPPSIGAYELGRTLTVAADGSGQYPTIQAAINAALSGDTVLLSDGTYSGPGNVDLDFGGRNITVTSVNGPFSTIIDCGGFSSTDGSGDHRGFYLHSGETSAVIRGLTIENGYETYASGIADSGFGGGIDNEGAGLTVKKCILQDNTAGYYGGGIYNNASISPVIVTNCILTGNSTPNGPGGGIENRIYNSSGTISMINCTITSNTGGGIYNEDDGTGTISIANCTLADNTNFGGILNNNGDGIISVTNCTLTGNSSNYGGGISNTNHGVGNGTIIVTNCTLTGNSANGGGGIYNLLNYGSSGPIRVTNCTLTGNTGGGIYNLLNQNSSGSINVTNDILYGDAGGEVANAPGNATNAIASDCDIQGGYPGTGNFDANPLLAPLGSYGGRTQTFALLPGSPCLGAGTNAGVAYDQRGVAIPQAGRYDIGAFESQGFTLAVTGGNNQTATVGTAFSAPLAVTVAANDPAGLEPVIGGQVTFTAPASGPSVGLTGSPAAIGTGGAASVTATANTLAGSYSVIPSAAGTATGGAAFSLTNGYGPTQTTLTSSLNPAPVGQSVTFTASVSGAAGTPTGSVTFTVDGAAQTPVAVDGSGHAAFSTSSLAVGAHSISAAYGGDATFAPSSTASPLTQTITALTTLTVASVTGSAGQTVTLSATLKKTGGTAQSGKTLSFSVDGASIGSAVSGSTGIASLHYVVPASLSVGGHTLAAAFAGDSAVAASSGTATLTVTKAPTALTVAAVSGASGQKVMLSATLKRANGSLALSGETVSFAVDGAAVGTAVTNASGVAALSYTIPAGAMVGSHAVAASFAGDGAYNPGTGKGTLTVKALTTLTVANVSGSRGTSVSLSATLSTSSGAPLAGRTVTFTVDGATVGTAVTNSAGTSARPYVIPAGAKVGAHSLGASFAGDGGDNPGSGKGTLTVS